MLPPLSNWIRRARRPRNCPCKFRSGQDIRNGAWARGGKTLLGACGSLFGNSSYSGEQAQEVYAMLRQMQRFAAAFGSIAAFGLGSQLLGVLAFTQPAPSQHPLPQNPLVDKFVLKDTIQPVSQGELIRAIGKANSDGAQALLVEMDTPGGLLESTRTMAGAILDSRVPIIVYVAPAGARAGSAGFFLLEAADIAAMDPGTNAGAGHPVLE